METMADCANAGNIAYRCRESGGLGRGEVTGKRIRSFQNDPRGVDSCLRSITVYYCACLGLIGSEKNKSFCGLALLLYPSCSLDPLSQDKVSAVPDQASGDLRTL